MKQLPQAVAELDHRIITFIEQGVRNQDDGTFNDLALAVFRLQYENIDLYRGYCRKRGVDPDSIDTWEQVPAVPTDVFKSADLSLFPPLAVRSFETSGTSDRQEKGTVRYDAGGLALMDATIRTAGESFLFPDGIQPSLLVLAPPPRMAPRMVMVYGMHRLIQYFGLPDSCFMIDEKGFLPDELVVALEHATEEGRPVAVCGGSFGFVNFFDYCQKRGCRFTLPKGSRCLDAGGFKGRSREVERQAFIDLCVHYLGIPEACSVNLLGMTETASQFYDDCLQNQGRRTTGARKKIAPPWTRTRVVDPETLEPLPEGETGLLKHWDLANRGHILALQTDDLGVAVAGGFEVLGRAGQGEAKGCSLTIDELTQAMG